MEKGNSILKTKIPFQTRSNSMEGEVNIGWLEQLPIFSIKKWSNENYILPMFLLAMKLISSSRWQPVTSAIFLNK